MIENVILNYLSDHLDVPVLMEVPKTMPSAFVVIEKTSASRTNYIDSSTLAIQSYGDSLLHAAELSSQVKDAMYDSIQLNEVSRCELNSEYNYTDDRYRCFTWQWGGE
jgi:hypothetical protein